MKQTLITSACIFLFLVASYVAIMYQKYKNFTRFLKPGDPVRFYVGEETYYGRVTLLGRKFVHIETDRLNGSKITRKALYSDVYPVLFYRYRKFKV